MNNFVLESYLNTKEALREYIGSNPIFKAYVNGYLVIYEGNRESVMYFNSLSEHIEESIENTLKTIHARKPDYSLKNIDVRSLDQMEFIGAVQEGYVFSIKNPMIKEYTYLASLIVCFDKKPSIEDMISSLNFNYLEQFLFHMQTLTTNYTKLFYIIDMFTELLEKKDHYMPYHMTNVATWVIKLSHKLNLSFKDELTLYIAALLHDIGKLYVKDEIVNKTSDLTDIEQARMNQHAVKGSQILQTVLYGMSLFDHVPEVVRHHHEYYDGSGYPDHLKGEEIPYLSRILTLVDSMDAMLSKRINKEAKSSLEVIKELKKMAGIQFDPILVQYAIELIQENKAHIEFSSMTHSNFIANASLSFYYQDYMRVETYKGNLFFKNKQALFINDSDDSVDVTMDPDRIFKATIGFFEMHDYYEFTCKINSIQMKQFNLVDITYLPTDKYFSMVINEPGTILRNRSKLDVEMIKLGGDTIIFQIPKTSGNCLDMLYNEQVVVGFNASISSEIGMKSVRARVIKVYDTFESLVYVCKMIELTATQRDSILRYLFRKQLAHRKNLRS